MMQVSWDFAKRSYQDEFEDWWEKCPKKAGKPRAATLYKRLSLDDRRSLVVWTNQYRRVCLSQAMDSKYILHPATIISQRRWEDEPVRLEKTEGEKEWDTLMSYVAQYGRYGTASLPLSNKGLECLRAIGGFTNICNATDAGVKKLRSSFLEKY